MDLFITKVFSDAFGNTSTLSFNIQGAFLFLCMLIGFVWMMYQIGTKIRDLISGKKSDDEVVDRL